MEPGIVVLIGVAGVEALPAPRSAVAAHITDLALRSAVADAVAAIQERAAGAAPGQLALAAGEPGEVALAGTGARGGIALTREDPVADEIARGDRP